MSTEATCGKCGVSLNERPSLQPRFPCPSCGSTNRAVHETNEVVLTPKESLKVRVKRQGKSKPLIEDFHGDDLHRQTGKWNKKARVIDQEKDYYCEIIADPDTGEVILHQEGKLSEHRGHGSAKYPKKK